MNVQPQEPRAQIMQLTQGWVLLIDGKTLAYQTIPALTWGLAKALKKRPPVAQTADPETQASAPAVPTDDKNLQVQLFNFGQVMSDLGNLNLANFERAEVQFFPDVHHLGWAAKMIQEATINLANRPQTEHMHSDMPAVDPKASARDAARAVARAQAEHAILGAEVNEPETAWVHDECGRTSDCFINTPHGIELITGDEPCARCQQCLDNECPLKGAIESDEEDAEPHEPLDIEPDDDFHWTTPGIVLNEKGEKIGMIEV